MVRKQNLLEKIVDNIGAFIMFSILFVTFYQVVSRYVLNTPLFWSEELTRYLLIWMTMIGSAMALSKHEHFSITTFIDCFSLGGQKLMYYLRNFVLFIVLIIISYYGYAFAILNSTQYSPSIYWLSLFWACLALPVGFALMLLCVIKDVFFTNFEEAKKRENRYGS